MVSYKLGIYNKDIVKVLDLNFKTLKDIDKFTMPFNDEDNLKNYLITNRIMNIDDIKYKVRIIYKYKKEIKKLPILYSNVKENMMLGNLKCRLFELSTNIEFLEKLANHYSLGSAKYNPQYTNVSDIRIYLSDVRNSGHIFNSKMLSIALDDLFNKATTNTNYNTGEVTENYRGLRDLCLFISRYDEINKLKNIKTEIKEESTPFKKYEGEQISLFDAVKIKEKNKDN